MTNTNVTTEFSHPFFAGMDPEHLHALGELSMPAKFAPGEVIFREGEPANRFYLIQNGKVSLETNVAGRGPLVIDEIGAGDVLGWSWLYEPYVWNFDARAIEPTTAWFIYGTRLREQCEDDPALGFDIMKRISEVILNRLQATRRRLVELATVTKTEIKT